MESADLPTIRDRLRTETRAVHDALDAAVSELDLTHPPEYARFLALQLAAREPVEAWCALHAPDDLRPPPQSPLIRSDLAALGCPAVPPPSARPLPLPADADPLAVAWVLAGSSLGNRAMLAWMNKPAANTLPVAFLSDPEMSAFWTRLKPRLSHPAGAIALAGALETARAVFAHFLAQTHTAPGKIAA